MVDDPTEKKSLKTKGEDTSEEDEMNESEKTLRETISIIISDKYTDDDLFGFVRDTFGDWKVE